MVPTLSILTRFGRINGTRFVSGVPKIDQMDEHPLRERQEALLLERLPKHLASAEQIAKLAAIEDPGRVLLMKSRIGDFTGKAIILAVDSSAVSTSAFPGETVFTSIDKADTQLFVEQCQRYVEFTDDIARLAQMKDGFQRIVTLTGVPKGYTRKDVAALIGDATKQAVTTECLTDIVFRFKTNGNQSDTVFVALKSEADALCVIKSVQEFAVPVRRIYGTSFGCSFVYADRSFLFLADPTLDNHVLAGSKCWVMTLGWNPELDADQLAGVLHKMAIYPNRIVKVTHGMGGEFLLRFDRMKNTKLVFTRLNRLKRRWRIPQNTPFFAYPVNADIHYAGDAKHADEDSDCDSDLDEPVMY